MAPEALRTKRVGVSGVGVRTTLVVGSELVNVEQLAATAAFQWHLGARHSLSVGAGVLAGGTLFYRGGSYHLGPGATASLSYSFLAVEPKGAVPFVMVTGAVSGTGAPTRVGSYWGVDGRVAASVGWLLFNRVSPYAVTRFYGGPVFWQGLTGGDRWHFQLGAGVVVGLPGGFDLIAECIPLGEQALSAGVGFSF